MNMSHPSNWKSSSSTEVCFHIIHMMYSPNSKSLLLLARIAITMVSIVKKVCNDYFSSVGLFSAQQAPVYELSATRGSVPYQVIHRI